MKKFLTLTLSLLLLFTAVACSNKTTAPTKTNTGTKTETKTETTDKATDKTYVNNYTGLYDKSVGTLTDYNMYTDVNTVTNTYKNKKYPGNEQYLNEVKAAYKDSKEKIRAFVDGLKKDVKTEDPELKKMNESLIAEGEKSIKDIDAKIAKLDKISKSDYNKPQDEFIKLVDDTVRAGENVTNNFVKMLKDVDTKLGITRNTK
ncbi:hypothetical protein [Terrisporobacter mayombei]|uniref:Lipoprotein n=1 Tax=Terrisporobacter mayombei TaxID=1541 RepID=A0ABY9Q063_9FIRM|nr:hypothetical protein [Terrisporobacter mayombei]MCC3867845.1 hypothetical protein [Terrisporobacter mayombei]WMT79977.1 hypothetical protein TEMA_02490 [Terrisporobacter mayombei]